MLRVVFKNLNELNMLWLTIADMLHAINIRRTGPYMLCARVSVTLIVKSVTTVCIGFHYHTSTMCMTVLLWIKSKGNFEFDKIILLGEM